MPSTSVIESIRQLMAEQLAEAEAGQSYSHAMYQAPEEDTTAPPDQQPEVADTPEPPTPSDTAAAEELTPPTISPIDSAEEIPEQPEDTATPPDIEPGKTRTDDPQEPLPASGEIASTAEEPQQQVGAPDEAEPLPVITNEDEPDDETTWPGDNAEMASAESIPIPTEALDIELPDISGEPTPTSTAAEWTVTPWEPPADRQEFAQQLSQFEDQLTQMAFAPIPEPETFKTPRRHPSEDMLSMLDATRIL